MSRYLRQFGIIMLLAVCFQPWANAQETDTLPNPKAEQARFEALRAQAVRQLEAGSYEPAIQTAQEALTTTGKNNDTELLLVLARAFKGKEEYATSLNYYLRAQRIYTETREQSAQANLATEIGNLYRTWGINEKAVEYYQSAYQKWKQLRYEAGQIETLTELIVLHQSLNNYQASLKYNKALLEIYERKNEPRRVINLLSNLSNTYVQAGEPEEAIAIQQRILKLNKELDNQEGMSSAYNNLGFLYRRVGRLEESLNAFNQSLSYGTAKNPVTLVNIGVIHQVMGDYEASLLSFFEAAKIYEKERKAAEVAKVCNYIASVYQGIGDSDNAYRFVNRAIEFGESVDSKETLKTSYKILSDLYAEVGRNKKALKYYKKYVATEDTLQQLERARLQNELQKLVEAEKKEKDLKLLLVDKQINRMALNRLQLETEKKEREFQIAIQQKELKNAELQQKELERERDLQRLRLEKQRIEDEKRQREISILQTQDSLQTLVLQQKLLEENERKKDIELLRQREAVQRMKVAEEKANAEEQRRIFWITLGLASVILLLILVGYWTKRRDNAKLQKQQNTLNEQNQKLREQSDAIQMQAEELMQQRDFIEEKNKELESQKAAIERAYENIKVLGDIGQKITANLDLSLIVQTVYENVNQLMPAASFGIGVYNEKNNSLDFQDFIEKKERLPFSSDSLSETGLPSVRCFLNQQEIVINNLKEGYHILALSSKTEENRGEIPASFVYLPLKIKDRMVGVITVQSFKENAYSEADISLLRSLASYAAIALDNSNAYDRLKEGNTIIEEKNQQIMASLRYARTIEEAILPGDEWFAGHFREHFVIYLPKDIVSGDFYWGFEHENICFVVVVDCTGHGVPGAFMSMTANALLNRIIKEGQTYDPAQILLKLDEGLDEIFKHSDRTLNAGMDVSVCRLTKKGDGKTALCFAGAKRPLYFFADGKLKSFRGDRFSIGHGTDRRKRSNAPVFSNHKAMLEAGTTVYLGTDGYTDNPGSVGMKLGTNTLKRKLVQMQGLSLAEQEQHLMQLLRQEQGDQPQRDDITLIGLKVS